MGIVIAGENSSYPFTVYFLTLARFPYVMNNILFSPISLVVISPLVVLIIWYAHSMKTAVDCMTLPCIAILEADDYTVVTLGNSVSIKGLHFCIFTWQKSLGHSLVSLS